MTIKSKTEKNHLIVIPPGASFDGSGLVPGRNLATKQLNRSNKSPKQLITINSKVMFAQINCFILFCLLFTQIQLIVFFYFVF